MSRLTILTASLLILGLAGCHQTGRTRPGTTTAEDLDAAAGSKVSGKQAADVQFAVGRSLEDGGDVVGAEAAYRKALENDPKRGDVHARLAILCDGKGDFGAASDHYARAIRRNPKDADLLCDRGYHEYIQKRYREAEADFRKAIAIDPRHARSHGNLALILARRDDTGEALQEFAKAGCGPAEARANLGLILAMQGHYPEAETALAAAVVDKPDMPQARAGLRAVSAAMRGVPSVGPGPSTSPSLANAADSSVLRASHVSPDGDNEATGPR